MATPYDPTLILLGTVLQKIFSITPSPYDTLPILVGKVQTAMGQTNTPYDKLEKALLEIGAGLPSGVLAAALAYLAPAPASNPLLTDLVAFWKMDETGNVVRRDSHTGAHDLSLAGTVNQAIGKLGNGANFAFNTANFLFNNETLWAGTAPFTVFFWVNFNGNLNQIQHLVGHYSSAGLGNGWRIRQTGASRIGIEVADGAGGSTALNHTGVIATGAFRLVIAEFTTATTAKIRLDNLADVSGSIVTPSNPASTPLRIGLTANATNPADAIIDAVGFYNRVLTEDEKTALWNGGVGKQYPFT
jgi:hypothetical protein